MTAASVILLDVEGTTTPINFVYGTLFPYARLHIREFLRLHQSNPVVIDALQQLRTDNGADVPSGAPAMTGRQLIQEASDYLLWLMDRDRKSSPLKVIQGLIWQQGFESAELQSEMFSDVPECLRRWHEDGRRIAIYSSGSVLAQKMLFAHTQYGDLTRYIDGYFDTQVGAKRDPRSYKQILAELKQSGNQCLFISDVTEELEAAACAGFETALSVRPRNTLQAEAAKYRVIHSFHELFDSSELMSTPSGSKEEDVK